MKYKGYIGIAEFDMAKRPPPGSVFCAYWAIRCELRDWSA